MADEENPDQNQNPTGPSGKSDAVQSSADASSPQPIASRNLLGWLVIGGLLVFFIVVMQRQDKDKAKVVDPAVFLTWVEEGRFKGDILVRDHEIVGTPDFDHPEGTSGFPVELRAGDPVRFPISLQTKRFYVERLLDTKHHLITIREESGEGSIWIQLLIGWGPILFILFLIYFVVFRNIAKVQAIKDQQNQHDQQD